VRRDKSVQVEVDRLNESGKHNLIS